MEDRVIQRGLGDPVPVVSVVIPTYNRAKVLGRCLNSLVEQSFKDFEVVICDDGSSDNTAEIVTKFKDRLRIKYCWSENFGGPARPRNQGIKKSIGKYVAFLDSDDWWTPEKLAVSVAALDKGADLVYHDLYVYKEKDIGRKRPRTLGVRALYDPIFNDLLLNGNAISNSSVVIRKALLMAVNGISEDPELIAVEDYDTWLRVSKLTSRFELIYGCYGWYAAGVDNLSGAQRIERGINRIIELYVKDHKTPTPLWMNYSLSAMYLELGQFHKSRKLAAQIFLEFHDVKLCVKSSNIILLTLLLAVWGSIRIKFQSLFF